MIGILLENYHKYRISLCITQLWFVSLYMSIFHDLGWETLSYWIDKKWNLIPELFTKGFILEAASFVLLNNNFQFDSYMFLQLVCTAMDMKFAPPYLYLSVGYLEEIILFPWLLPLHFTLTECILIEEIFKRFVGDGFVLWPKTANIDLFRELNELNLSLKFTGEKGKQLWPKLWYFCTSFKLFRCFHYFTSKWSVRNWYIL